eukprot:m.325852 g.325852  ORF g.325852 m.325852 type:complete len:330 (-) comp55565_c0_seq14:95-1084(-)
MEAWLRKRACSVLRCGPIPRHVAFIMDGNRRFANKMNVQTKKGHALGFEKLKETLEWCLNLGIDMVTVYAFSIENFKRSQSEVDGLMELAVSGFNQLLEQSELIQKHEVCVRIFGDVSLLPHEVQVAVAKCVNLSRANKRAVLNVCFAYTSRDEMTRAARDIVRGVQSGHLLPEDVDEELVELCLDTEAAPEPDLMIRTSGEVRLSDFLLWQVSHSLTPRCQVSSISTSLRIARAPFRPCRSRPPCGQNFRSGISPSASSNISFLIQICRRPGKPISWHGLKPRAHNCKQWCSRCRLSHPLPRWQISRNFRQTGDRGDSTSSKAFTNRG